MEQRIKLHDALVQILQSENIGTVDDDHVYFQPSANIKMQYPCIVYSRDAKSEVFANNLLYIGKVRYSIKVIDRNPDSKIPNKVAKMPYTSFNTHYVVDNLNHDVYSTYI